MPKGKHRFQINYKSGQSIEVTADKLEAEWARADSRVVTLTWSNMQPQPLMAGLHNIESIWQLS